MLKQSSPTPSPSEYLVWWFVLGSALGRLRDSDKDEVEVVDEGHSDGHESDEVCVERVLVLIG